jgi:peptidoglycan LD-endopeptidase LytH
MPSRSRKSPLRHLAWILPLLALDFFVFRWLALRHAAHSGYEPTPLPSAASAVPAAPKPPPPIWNGMVPPTPQTNLLNPDEPGVLMPTGSGRLESAKFGSTRTVKRGSRFVPSFHEGVDVAPMQRDRRGAATDPVFSIAPGRVAFVNNVAGNSTYGKYVVVEHSDPSLGFTTRRDGTVDAAQVYSLYAHLADVRFGIRPGQAVDAGDELGTMGATSSTRPPIPLVRSHLHWEIGVLLNSRFEAFHRRQKNNMPFGNYNGGNLFGFDALDFWAARHRDPLLTMATYLASVPPAFEALVRGKRPDYFKRFPALWKGAPFNEGPIWIAVSESGAPLSARNATPGEIDFLGNRRLDVLRVHPETLGRNGRALVAQSSGKWAFTQRGRQWADLLLF